MTLRDVSSDDASRPYLKHSGTIPQHSVFLSEVDMGRDLFVYLGRYHCHAGGTTVVKVLEREIHLHFNLQITAKCDHMRTMQVYVFVYCPLILMWYVISSCVTEHVRFITQHSVTLRLIMSGKNELAGVCPGPGWCFFFFF